MKNKKIIIGSVILATVAGYLYFIKNKNDQKKPYTNAELEKALKEFINKTINYLKSNGKTDGLRDFDYILPRLKYFFEQAELKGKDVSRKNVNEILKLLYIDSLVKYEDTSKGVLSRSQKNKLQNFMGENFEQYFYKE
jgi:hypothetical protein